MMNFMSRMEGQETQLELKYCERCGGLWLRPKGTDGVHCMSCHVLLGARPDPGEAPAGKVRRRKRRGQGADMQIDSNRGDQPQNPARIEDLQGVATMEVRA